MLWIVWIATILMVIATKAYTTRTVIRTRFKMEAMQKRAIHVKQQEKVARSNLEVTRRGLEQVQKTISAQTEAIEKMKQVLETLEQQKRKKMQEAESKLSV